LVVRRVLSSRGQFSATVIDNFLMRWKMLVLAGLVVSTAAILVADPDASPTIRAMALPRPAHVVVVVLENRSAVDVAGVASTPFIDSLAGNGAVFTDSFAITHPSLPNYLALFSGSTHGVENDRCTQQFDGPNLASSLISAGRTFIGYVQGLPAPASNTCRQGNYDKVLAPWKFFADVPTWVSRPVSVFPRDFARLPDLSFLTPDLAHDMHSGTMRTADRWLMAHVGSYVRWARSHNSLLVLTWDEDDHEEANRILTIITGAHVNPGRYSQHITHYSVLRTLTGLERVAPIGAAHGAQPIEDIWTTRSSH
jgi:phosphatidylinositol-3-phosphatase